MCADVGVCVCADIGVCVLMFVGLSIKIEVSWEWPPFGVCLSGPMKGGCAEGRLVDSVKLQAQLWRLMRPLSCLLR